MPTELGEGKALRFQCMAMTLPGAAFAPSQIMQGCEAQTTYQRSEVFCSAPPEDLGECIWTGLWYIGNYN